MSTICRLTITHHLDWTHQLKNGVISLIVGLRPLPRWVALKVFLVPGANWQKHRKPSEYPSMVELLMKLWYTQTVDKHDAIEGEGRYSHRTMSMEQE